MKKNKFLLVLMFAMLVLPCVIFVGGCSKHSAETEWIVSDSAHWHACTKEGCTEKFDYENHKYRDDNICEVCYKENNFVKATIGTGANKKGFRSFGDAIKDAKDGEAVLLLDDFLGTASVYGNLVIKNSITIDLNGKTLTGSANNQCNGVNGGSTYYGNRLFRFMGENKTSVIKNGKIVYNCNYPTVAIENGANSNLTIENVEITTNEKVGVVCPRDNSVTTIKNCTITTQNKAITTDYLFELTDNKKVARDGTCTINIKDSTLTSSEDVAIMIEGYYQTYNIENSTITGLWSAMQVSMGKINIDATSKLICTRNTFSVRTVVDFKNEQINRRDVYDDETSFEKDGVALVVCVNNFYDGEANTNDIEINIENGAQLVSNANNSTTNIVVYNYNNINGDLETEGEYNSGAEDRYSQLKLQFDTRNDVKYYQYNTTSNSIVDD